MGQQQLLLVILVTIIVGIATVVAINVFGSAADNANVSAVRQDLLSMASAAQAYYMKPDMMAGGGGDFTGIEWQNLGGIATDPSADGTAENANGTYTMTEASDGTTVTISATPKSAGGEIVILVCADGAALSDYAPNGTATVPSDCDPTNDGGGTSS